ncbi:HAD-IB family hydrolase [Corynebacterium sanguinis]|uniref:HAD-IB family hydrolase n=1 Tax=Corynebacterium sanguinis TaxID=2594913 RepID=A0A6C1TY83_9CORY|nr:HAD-IB family hydrolase [Corynebacterium sanguinis]MBA4505496.1 HAD-IB family hydrolase [Corynebacterium sanguinis]MCT1412010.1 HAD-IB family hydrolase [Corynebacterium sanguinis]MCT1425775.1 HAD-IB family hydrolase [Corynebacterium sanguinis]MCT1444611.1 HAD-IB family hydrolase [Corynebacterium sanguinis]MCT1491817.1 HAD-IB family hydrolase [Corynebacterium sanguinis]
MSADSAHRPGREFLAQWSASHGNVRRFLEELAVPPLDDASQRAAGEAAAAAAIEETFGLSIDEFTLGVDTVGGAFATAGAARVTQPDPDVPQDAEAAAFFDIDNTLIQGSSLVLLGRGLAKKRMITLRELLPGLTKQLRYRVFGSEKTSDIASGRAHALGLARGKKVSDLLELADDIVDHQILGRAFDPTLQLAHMHLAAGQQVWLVSATPVQIGQALAARLGFTGALGTVAEAEDGVFTGRLVGDILHGPGKRHAVAALAALQQLDLKQCTAYSDSINDIPMLSMVGTPVAVNPDRALRKHAQDKGWEIRDYRSVRKAAVPATVAVVFAAAGAWALWRTK